MIIVDIGSDKKIAADVQCLQFSQISDGCQGLAWSILPDEADSLLELEGAVRCSLPDGLWR